MIIQMNHTIKYDLILEKGVSDMSRMRCSECGARNKYEFKETDRRYQGDGYDFTLSVKVPFCSMCGAPISNEEIESEIACEANEKIRESRGIITKEEIINILQKYNVSQKYLSRLLGWGEITLTRYVSGGYTPNANNSEKLKAINDPYVLKKIMTERADESDGEIEKEASFQKLLHNVNLQIENVEKEKGKIFRIANWFLSQASEENYITHLALQKLLYFSQGWNYVFNNRSMFPDDCEAWVHGAVYRSVFDTFKKFKYKPLPVIDREIKIPQEELDVLNYVKNYYFDIYNAKSLEKICHLEEPYLLARKEYETDENCQEIIKKDLIRKYYLSIAQKYNISRNHAAHIQCYLDDLLRCDHVQ